MGLREQDLQRSPRVASLPTFLAKQESRAPGRGLTAATICTTYRFCIRPDLMDVEDKNVSPEKFRGMHYILLFHQPGKLRLEGNAEGGAFLRGGDDLLGKPGSQGGGLRVLFAGNQSAGKDRGEQIAGAWKCLPMRFAW